VLAAQLAAQAGGNTHAARAAADDDDFRDAGGLRVHRESLLQCSMKVSRKVCDGSDAGPGGDRGNN